MSYIKHIIEFNKLNLVWQSENDPNHLRYVVAELIKNDNGVQLRYLNSTEDFKKAVSFGFVGYPAFSAEVELHSNRVLEAFQRRLPPRGREDFGKYLEMFRLPKNSEISDFSLLGYSGAKLPGDEFSIIPSFQEIDQPYEFLTEVTGFRHHSPIPIGEIALGSLVTFEAEPENSIDPNAIKILMQGKKIGYVTRPLLNDFHNWLNENRIERVVVEKKNGQPDRPTLYIFVEIKAKTQKAKSQYE